MTPITGGDPPAGRTSVGDMLELGPAGTTFAEPVTVTLSFDAARLPEGVGPDQVRIDTAPTAEGPFTALESVVDAEAGTVSAQVEHFSVFVPTVEAPAGDDGGGDESDGGGCADAAPLTPTKSIDLPSDPNYVCAGEGYLRVSLGGGDQAYDPATLEHLGEQGSCTDPKLTSPSGGSYTDRRLKGSDGDVQFSVAWRRQDRSRPRWWEATLTLETAAGSRRYSFNGVHNDPRGVDEGVSLPRDSALVGRLEGRTLRLYLYVMRAYFVDMMQIDDVDAFVASSDDPDHELRFELADRPAENSGGELYEHRGLAVVADPADGDDILGLIDKTDLEKFIGFRVSVDDAEGFDLEQLDSLELNDFYSQGAWNLLGVDSAGTAWLQGRVGSFEKGMLAGVDLAQWTKLGEWEHDCISAPNQGHSGIVPWKPGLVYWVGSEGAVAFLQDGALHSIARSPLGSPDTTQEVSALSTEEVGLLYVGGNGKLLAFPVP